MSMMDLFDFSAPISATIIFDDSEDEACEIEKDGKNNLFAITTTEVMRNSKTKTDLSSRPVLDIIRASSENNTVRSRCNTIVNEHISEKTNNYVLQKKPLDMPSLDDKNNKLVERHCSDDDKNNNNINTDIQIESEISTKSKKVSKSSLSMKSINSDKTWEPIKSPNKKSKHDKRPVEEMSSCNKITRMETQEKDTSLQKNTGVQEQGSDVLVRLNSLPTYDQAVYNKELYPDAAQKHCMPSAKTISSNSETDSEFRSINQKQSNDDNVSQTLNEFNETLAGYFKGLLDTVSQHMIYVLNCYKHFCNIYQTSKDHIFRENARAEYDRSKKYFFDLSYSSVVNIILPRNNDPTFVRNFLSDTAHISSLQSQHNHTPYEIEILYNSMLSWTKYRQSQLLAFNSKDSLTTSNPLLHQKLQMDPRGNPTIIDQNKENKLYQKSKSKKISQPCTRSIEGVDRRQNSYTQSQHTYPVIGRISNPQSQSLPSNFNPNSNPCYNQTPAINEYCFQSPPRHAEKSNLEWHSDQQTGQRAHNKNQIRGKTSDQNIQPMSNQSQFLLQNLMKSKQPYNPVPTAATHHSSISHWQKSVQQAEQNQAPQAWQNNRLSSTQTYQHQNKNRMSCQDYTSGPENTSQGELLRSSISRDSGFISPLSFNSSGEIWSHEEQQRLQPNSTLPLITHVTSLNPDVSLIEEGKCVMCQKTTKQKCLGCFTYYYCSSECQVKDWAFHQMICKYQN